MSHFLLKVSYISFRLILPLFILLLLDHLNLMMRILSISFLTSFTKCLDEIDDLVHVVLLPSVWTLRRGLISLLLLRIWKCFIDFIFKFINCLFKGRIHPLAILPLSWIKSPISLHLHCSIMQWSLLRN